MKAQELRIGNWVDIKSFNGNQGIVRTQFNYDLLRYIHLCEPIPLTPEILEKCGFKKIHEANKHFAINDPNGYAGKYKISIFQTLNNQWQIAFSDEVSSYKDYIPTTKISYLHQLQNLIYALTGEELEFKP